MEKTKVCPYRNKHEMCEKPNSNKNGTLCLFDKTECSGDKKKDVK